MPGVVLRRLEKTPAAFLAAKAWMVSLSKRSAPDQFLTATICRQRLSVDAAAALRLWSYLDAVGAVNAAVPPDRRRRPAARARRPLLPRTKICGRRGASKRWWRRRSAALADGASDVSQSEGGVSRPRAARVRRLVCVKEIAKSEPPVQGLYRGIRRRQALGGFEAEALDRLEDRVARLSDLERQLADDQAGTVERARSRPSGRAWR